MIGSGDLPKQNLHKIKDLTLQFSLSQALNLFERVIMRLFLLVMMSFLSELVQARLSPELENRLRLAVQHGRTIEVQEILGQNLLDLAFRIKLAGKKSFLNS